MSWIESGNFSDAPLARVEQALGATKDGETSPQQAISRLFAVVREHAGGPALADDATAVIAGW